MNTPNPTATRLTTQQALAVLNSLSPSIYRTGQVLVDCQTSGENASVSAAASRALKAGYVVSYQIDPKGVDHTVAISFRRPITAVTPDSVSIPIAGPGSNSADE